MAETITISRDERGVPHIQAATEHGAIYAQGYVQALDRLPSVYFGYRLVTGTLEDYFEQTDDDLPPLAEISAVYRRYPLCKDVAVLPADDRALLQTFIAGLNAGIVASRERWGPAVMAKHIEPTPQLALQLSQAVTFPFIMDQVWQLLATSTGDVGPVPPPLPWQLASNAWAVRPQRSADGSTILLTDPHVLYTAPWLLHEVELRGGELQLYGFQHPGTPYVHFGHTPHIAWGFTAGGAKVVNVERLAAGAERPRSGQVLAVDDAKPGPGTALHITTTYDDVPFDHITPLRKLAHARSIADVQAVIALNQFGPWNMVAADSAGNIHYSIIGRVPLAGDVAQGLHNAAELPQVTNPPAGWVLHTNCSPWNVTPQSPLSPAAYPDYMLFSTAPDSEDGNNPRGRDLHQRLAAHERMTLQQAQAIAMSVDMSQAEPLLQDVRRLVQALAQQAGWRETYGHLALDVLNDNLTLENPFESTALAFFIELYMTLYDADLLEPEQLRLHQHVGTDKLADALITAAENTVGAVLGTAAPYADYLRLKRNGKSVGVVGAPNFCQRIVGNVTGDEFVATSAEGDIWVKTVDYGQVCPLLVAFTTDGVRSFTVVPFGQSDDPHSPHYDDQMTTFAAAQFYETHFAKQVSGATIETIVMA